MNPNPTFDSASRVLAFSVSVAGKMVDCRVTEDWLREAYGPEALDGGALRAFSRRRANLEAAALRAWLASRGAAPVWLKRDHDWRQQPSGEAADARRQPDKLTI
jgi:hypothetical protein